MSHACNNRFCQAPIGVECGPGAFLCADCWLVVPPDVAARLYRHFTAGQCENPLLANGEWRRAAVEARCTAEAASSMCPS